jgi:hypothetical protein
LPYVFMVNGWRVWTESGRNLNQEVVRRRDEQGSAWDFYHLLDEWCVGRLRRPENCDALEASLVRGAKALSSDTTWNPHPLNSTFAPSFVDETSMRARKNSHPAP